MRRRLPSASSGWGRRSESCSTKAGEEYKAAGEIKKGGSIEEPSEEQSVSGFQVDKLNRVAEFLGKSGISPGFKFTLTLFITNSLPPEIFLYILLVIG